MYKHPYIPCGSQELKELLAAVGVDDVDNLFKSVPKELFIDSPPIGKALEVEEIRKLFHTLASKNKFTLERSFIGGGIYRHFVPPPVRYITSLPEFLTIYTPYQPEISQGILQAMYEYQTLICQLTDMEVSNASLYDGATAFVESVFMAKRVSKKGNTVAIPKSLHPHYRDTLKTYISNLEIDIKEIDWDPMTGEIEIDKLGKTLSDEVFALAVQSPNYFGVVERIDAVRSISKDIILIVVVTEPLSMALFKPPGFFGADIVTGEAQSFGLYPSWGGPLIGFLATKASLIRHLPGRLIGETVDKDGKRAFVATLSTREQHIRRERATSNICTNQTLAALAVTVFLSLYGKCGLRKLAEKNYNRAHLLAKMLKDAGVKVTFEGTFFNEFVVEVKDIKKVFAKARKVGIYPGIDLARYYKYMQNHLLVSVTELNKPETFEEFVDILREDF